MPGISFDRAADIYDGTRGYSEGSAERVAEAVASYAGAGQATRFLELGVGTGRIALPFIRAGYDYTGVDISEAMMDRLRAKLAADPQPDGYRYELRQADITALPFADDSFDVVIAVHVFHLVSDWRAAAREARRVLRPGGLLLVARDDFPGDHDEHPQSLLPPLLVRRRWMEIRRELGMPEPEGFRVMFSHKGAFEDYLRELGAAVDHVALAEIHRPPVSPRAMFEQIRQRMYSADWETSDEQHAEGLRRLADWMDAQPFDPDQVVDTVGQFRGVAARFAD